MNILMTINKTHFGLDGRKGVTTILATASLISCLPLGLLLFHNILSAKVVQIAAMAIGGGSLALNVGGSFIDFPRLAWKSLKERKIQVFIMSFLSIALATCGALSFGGVLPKFGLFIAATTIGGITFLASVISIIVLLCRPKAKDPYFQGNDWGSPTIASRPPSTSPEYEEEQHPLFTPQQYFDYLKAENN